LNVGCFHKLYNRDKESCRCLCAFSCAGEVKVQADGKIVLAGSFVSFNGVVCNRIIRLNTNGSIDASFVTGVDLMTMLQRSLYSLTEKLL
jgi:hypothetical protein